MNTYREFTVKQQIIFYVVTLLVAGACFYLDITHELGASKNGTQTEAAKFEPAKKFFSGNEVAHSTFAAFEVK